MSDLLAGLLLIITIMLQSGVASRITFLSGAADLILLFIAAWGLQGQTKRIWLWTVLAGFFASLLSAMPLYAPFFGYLFITVLSQIIKRRFWESPVLAMLIVVFLGTLVQHIIYYFVLIFTGTGIDWQESLNMVTLPSLLINLVLAFPVYIVIREIALIIIPESALR